MHILKVTIWSVKHGVNEEPLLIFTKSDDVFPLKHKLANHVKGIAEQEQSKDETAKLWQLSLSCV